MKAEAVKAMNSLASISRRGRLSRLIHVACAIFVTSYLLFDVLDLDGSQHAPTPPSRSKVFIDSNDAEIKPIASPTICELKFGSVTEVKSCREISASVLLARELKFSALKASRRHRIALPRSSVTDSASPAQA